MWHISIGGHCVKFFVTAVWRATPIPELLQELVHLCLRDVDMVKHVIVPEYHRQFNLLSFILYIL